ncbi:lipopolysaccharide heptosyltransferase II [Methylacidiphilum caldifontis]|uniref:lipopolysaccharide heptosyltransferase II n=1 Tax=Methylacidiphilum caldifontis TaxID=2795386 RepID=A0A4Y8P954_9BACT|nr:lipopolysaccharide heptosyltransferase II [Methylacidiphilum caldifontis]TFE67202.1 lipopolysaccharide heptosyltransferase II [Methylacidiphilum caldifontis]
MDFEPLRGPLLIRSPNWLGDAIMSLLAVTGIKEISGSCPLIVATPQKIAYLWSLCPFVDEVLEMENSKNVFENVKRLRKKKIGTALLFTRSVRTALECKLAGIPKVIGFGRTDQSFLLDKRVIIPKASELAHQSQIYILLAQFVGAKKINYSLPFLKLPKQWQKPQEPIIVSVCPGAEYGPAKRWFPSSFAWVCQRLKEKYGCHIQILGAEKDKAVCQQLQQEIQSAENLAGKTTLSEFMERIFRSHLLLCNDSGAMHVGSLVNTPTVAIFGSTDPQKTAPIGGRFRIFYNKVHCSPCFLRRCPIDMPCMRNIEPQNVLQACEEFLSLETNQKWPCE